MKLFKMCFFIILIFAVLSTLVIFPPDIKAGHGKKSEFLEFAVNYELIEYAHDTILDIANTHALLLPSSITYIFTKALVPIDNIIESFHAIAR